MPEIAVREKSEINRYRQAAKAYFYSRANRAGLIGSLGALLLALCAPVALLFVPAAGPGLGAAAGAWIFITRFGLERLRCEWQSKGVCAQEEFDCDVLGIAWNDSLARPLAPEEIRGAAGEVDLQQEAEPWYPSQGQDRWPTSVLICQRANAVWASRQHRSFALFLRAVTIGWGAIGIGLAIWHGASLEQYLTTVLLPSLPGLLDASDLSRRHLELGGRREEISYDLESLIKTGKAKDLDIRETQDRLFALRRDGAPVPEFFYRHIRDDYERDMQFGAEQMGSLSA
jgi:hypothetical protein